MIKKILITLSIIAAIGGGIALIGGAVTNWGQTIGWNINSDTNFAIYDSAISGTEISTPATLDLGTPSDPTVINYYIQNNGNVPITVTGDIVFNSGSATVTWNPVTGTVTVPVGTARAQITLTLTDFSVGTGEAVVSFASAEA